MTGLGTRGGWFGKSRPAYYQQLWQQDKKEVNQRAILNEVVKLREQLPGVGTGKLQHLLTDFLDEHHLKLGRDKLYDYPLGVNAITYIRTSNDFSYLSLITDAYSHKIMG